VNDTITYTIGVTNSVSDDPIEDFWVSDTLAAGLGLDLSSIRIDDVPVDNADFDTTTRELKIPLPSLDPRESLEITFNVTVLASAAGGTVSNVATLLSPSDGDGDLEKVAVTGEVDITIAQAPPAGGGGGGGGTDPIVEPPVEPEIAPETYFNHAFLIGMPDGTVRPEATITRAEVATIFFRLLDNDHRILRWWQQNPYSDVSRDAWYNNAISTITNAGMLIGLPDGTFAPNRPVTRAEFATIAARFVGGAQPYISEPAFEDIRGHWAEQYISAMAAIGLFYGDVTELGFAPDRYMRRSEVAATICRMLDRDLGTIENMQGATGEIIRWPDNGNERAWYYLYIQEATHSTEFYRHEGFVVWRRILEHIDWSVLERPDSLPYDLTPLLEAWHSL
jgi:fimbrial isopeptide formation D2 family protein